MLGEKKPMWKGDNVGYGSLHEWVRNYMAKPQFCAMCHIRKPYDLPNITGKYNRKFKNWKYLCRLCHMVSDKRIFYLKHYRTMTPSMTMTP